MVRKGSYLCNHFAITMRVHSIIYLTRADIPRPDNSIGETRNSTETAPLLMPIGFIAGSDFFHTSESTPDLPVTRLKSKGLRQRGFGFRKHSRLHKESADREEYSYIEGERPPNLGN